MTAFTSGQTISLSLDSDDYVSFNGQGVATITPASGSQFVTYLTGSQTLGPYKMLVTISIVTSSAGTYTQQSMIDVATHAVYSTDTSGNVTGLVGPNNQIMVNHAGFYKNPVAILKPQGSFENSGGVLGYTLSNTIVSPVPFFGFRLRFYGVCATAQINTTAGAAASKNMTSGYYAATETPVQVTVGGATSWTIPAATSGGGTANAVWSETVTDWIPCTSIARDDGGKGYLLVVRTYTPSAGNTESGRAPGLGTSTTHVNSYGYAAAAGNSVADMTFTNFASLTNAVSGLGSPIGIELLTNSGCVSIAAFGDSTIAGTDGVTGNAGGVTQAAMSLISAVNPVSWWNQGEASMNSTTYITLAETFLASGVKPNLAALCPWSPNDADGYSASGIARTMGVAMRFIHACRKVGAVPILLTPNPVGGLTSGQETFRRQAVTTIKQIGSAFGVTLIDRDAIFTDYTSATGGWLAGMNFNIVHASNAGYAAEAALWKSAIAPYTLA